MATVLIVDDVRSFRREHCDKLARYHDVEILEASTLEELDAVFTENRGRIDAIILDGLLDWRSGGDFEPQPDTADFVRRARGEGFEGLIVAASSADEFNEQLVRAGCNAGVPKPHAAAEVARRLHLVEE